MKKSIIFSATIMALIGGSFGFTPFMLNGAQAHHSNQCGRASWYALTSRTASGEMMNPAKLTAAHRTLPFGTKLKVTNKRNGKSVIVRINDRGPFIKGRIIDVSKAAAKKIGMIRSGHAPVCITRISS